MFSHNANYYVKNKYVFHKRYSKVKIFSCKGKGKAACGKNINNFRHNSMALHYKLNFGNTHNGLIGVDPGNDGLESLLVLSLPHVGVHVPHQRLHVPVLNTDKQWLKIYLGSMSRDVRSCSHWLRPRSPPPLPRIWAHIREALLVSKDRRHLLVTPCRQATIIERGTGQLVFLLPI
jgi:hypothetical protein